MSWRVGSHDKGRIWPTNSLVKRGYCACRRPKTARNGSIPSHYEIATHRLAVQRRQRRRAILPRVMPSAPKE